MHLDMIFISNVDNKHRVEYYDDENIENCRQ